PPGAPRTETGYLPTTHRSRPSQGLWRIPPGSPRTRLLGIGWSNLPGNPIPSGFPGLALPENLGPGVTGAVIVCSVITGTNLVLASAGASRPLVITSKVRRASSRSLVL